MLVCVKRIKNSSGDIVEYVFDDGTHISADKLKEQIKKNNDYVANLKLSVDGRIIKRSKKEQEFLRPVKGQTSNVSTVAHKSDSVSQMLGLVNKSYKLSKDEFKRLVDLLIKSTGLRSKVLNTKDREDGYVVLYQLGPYTLMGFWEKRRVSDFIETAKHHTDMRCSSVFRTCENYNCWELIVMYGNLKLKTLTLTNKNTIIRKGKNQRDGCVIYLGDEREVFINHERVYTQEELEAGISELVKKSYITFNAYTFMDKLYRKLEVCYDKGYIVIRTWKLNHVSMSHMLGEIKVCTEINNIEVFKLRTCNLSTEGGSWGLELFVFGKRVDMNINSLNNFASDFDNNVDSIINMVDSEIKDSVRDVAVSNKHVFDFIVRTLLEDKEMLAKTMNFIQSGN